MSEQKPRGCGGDPPEDADLVPVKLGKTKKPTPFEIANACNACGKQMDRGAVMVCHECAGKSTLHPTPLKIGETVRWKKDGDSPVLEKPALPPRSVMSPVGKRLHDLVSFATTCAHDFDCDADAHRYGTFCRACEAKKLIGEM